MDILDTIFEWIIIVISGVTIVFALVAVLSLFFDGFLDKLTSWFKKSSRK